MPSFTYKVRKRSGEVSSGEIGAADLREAGEKLRAEGFYIIELRRSRQITSESLNPFELAKRWLYNPVAAGVSVKEMAAFYLNISTMIRAGISILDTLRTIRDHGSNPRIGKIAGDCLIYIEKGETLSQAISKYPWIFPESHVVILRAAETSGAFDSILKKLAEFMENEFKTRQDLRIATFYPKILVLAIIFIPKIFVWFTRGFEAYARATFGILVPILALIFILWILHRWLNQIPKFRYIMDTFKLYTPLIGGVVRSGALAKFYRIFSIMLKAGVPISSGLRQAADACGNYNIADKLKSHLGMILEGHTIREALIKSRILPSMALDMLVTGGGTGNTDELLDKLADFAESDNRVKITQLTTGLGLILFLILAAIVFMIAVRFYSERLPTEIIDTEGISRFYVR